MSVRFHQAKTEKIYRLIPIHSFSMLGPNSLQNEGLDFFSFLIDLVLESTYPTDPLKTCGLTI